MSEKKTYIIEKIKSILIVVLFLTAVLLLYFFWADKDPFKMSLSDFSIGGGDSYERSLYAGNVLLPSRMEVVKDFGEMVVIEDSEKYYGNFSYVDTFLGSVRTFLTTGEIVLEEVPKEQYEEAYRFASVKCCFDYFLPAGEYLTYLGVEKLAGMENIQNIGEIGFVQGSPESLLIRDADTGKCYRIVSENPSTFVDRMLSDEEVQAMPNYYTIAEFMGEHVESDVMIPLNLEADIAKTQVTAEISPEDSERITGLARTFFGNSFDFVRKMGEVSGKITYMYGFAETVLIIDNDGSLEYKSENDASSSVGYFPSLDAALIFMDSHGFSQDEEKALKLKPFVSSAEPLSGGRKGYRFEFGMRSGGYSIFTEKPPVVVEVTGGVVSYYYRNVPVIGETAGKMQEAFSAINAIAVNYQSFQGYAVKNSLTREEGRPEPENSRQLTDEFSVDTVAGMIDSMKYGYLIREGEALPVWQVSLAGDDESLYFDLYTAEPVE